VDLYYFPMTYRALTLNGHRTAAGAENAALLGNSVRVNSFDFSRLQQRDQRESFHLISGGDLGDATAAFRFISVGGVITATTGAKLTDRISLVQQTFHVEQAQVNNPLTAGVVPFTFTDVTEVSTGRGTAYVDPVSGATTGEYVVERFYARPAGFPIITGRRSGGDSVLFSVELVCGDPRRYIDTPEAVVLNSGNGYSASCPNWNSNQGIALEPLLTIVMAGNGATNLTIDSSNDGQAALVLNMSAAGAGTFTVDCYTGIIKKSTTYRADLRTSGVLSFPRIMGGGSTVTVTNTTNVTSVTVGYRQARG
jgi:hypothetical protein